MGKLTDMVAEDLSLAEKVKINLRKVGLASVGLVSIVETERTRLYRQILEMGEAYGGRDTVAGRISLLGTGTVNLLLEETQRVFDELVEEGEQALSRSKQPALKSGQSATAKIAAPRPVAKSRVPENPGLKSVAKTPAKKSETKKPVTKTAAKPVVAKPAVERLSAELKQRLEAATRQLSTLELDEKQKLELTALSRQVQDGDVAGRRPAKSKPQEQALFDARLQVKGMKAEAALSRLEGLLKRLATSTSETAPAQ